MGIQLTNAFDTLRAEDEPWLDRCFIKTPQFERLLDNNSVIVFGDAGSGKSALYEMLKRHHQTTTGQPGRLFIDWQFTTPTKVNDSPLVTVALQVEHLYDLIAVALATHIAYYPESYSHAPDWAQQRVSWFIHNYLHDAPMTRLGHLFTQSLRGSTVLLEVLNTTPVQILYDDAPPEQALKELSLALAPLKLQSVWVMLDGLERFVALDETRLVTQLLNLLGTLVLFEHAELAFKLFAPARLEAQIIRASGLERRRLDSVRLRWSICDLEQMVERRLQLAMGDADFTLTKLCASPALRAWLEAAGGSSPRHWLDQVQPLVQYYIDQRLTAPIEEKIWHKLRSEYPPRLFFFREQQRVIVGGREVSLADIPVKALEMLAYLFEHGGQIVSKRDLYYRTYLGVENVPRAPGDAGYEGQKEWEGVVDTNIWRLRKAIEPYPKEPVLLQTVRGYGLRLHVRW